MNVTNKIEFKYDDFKIVILELNNCLYQASAYLFLHERLQHYIYRSMFTSMNESKDDIMDAVNLFIKRNKIKAVI